MRKDFNDFYKWINIDVDSATWQGENQKDYERFWLSLFVDGLSLKQLTERFEFAFFEAKAGSLEPWIRWVFEKMICYTFIKKDATVYQLSEKTRIPLSRVANILRNFFIDFHSDFGREISIKFQMSNLADENIDLKYYDICDKFPMEGIKFGSTDKEIMTSMEVTLYKEWKGFVQRLEKKFVDSEVDIQKVKKNMLLKKQFIFLRDVSLLLVAGIVMIGSIYQGNKIYKNYLEDRISIYEPQLKWDNEPLGLLEGAERRIASDIPDIEDIQQVEEGDGAVYGEEERFETESEVVLTSVDELPKDFDVVSMNQSGYGAQGTGGYRDSRYGTTKVYRVMMQSTDTLRSQETLDSIMVDYGATPVPDTESGNHIPGGLHYNMFVPRDHIKEFLTKIKEIDHAVLYESRTRTAQNEPGKDKVFIWVKSLN